MTAWPWTQAYKDALAEAGLRPLRWVHWLVTVPAALIVGILLWGMVAVTLVAVVLGVIAAL